MASKSLLVFKTLLFSAILPSIRSHPQCTDSYPPFEEINLQYCSQYRDFGCCVAERDAELENLSRSILDNVPENVRRNCESFVNDILCQECSPYAAHAFNMEGRSRTDWSDFPGLCSDYCVNFHQNCSQLLPYITRSGVLLDASGISATAFCEEQMIDDVDYCFPNVLTNFIDEVRESQIGSSDDCLCLEEFADNLRNPLALTFANDGTHRIYVVEQTGVVTIFLRNGSYLSEPFLDIQDLVEVSGRTGDERGLLGIAFHPNYAENFQFYVHYKTRIDGSLYVRISELKSFSDDTNVADVNSERVLIQVRQPAGNHNGGSLFFDLEGYLYISLGDGGIAGDPFGVYGNGLNLTTFLGKILRIDVNGRDGSLPYAIPPDNPFVGQNPETMLHEIFAYGVRNMWRCSVDRGDPDTGYGAGRIFCGDVGQNRYEEIDIIVNGGNYGWRAMEGNSCFDSNLCNNPQFIGDNYVGPIHAYNHTVGKSVTGGYVYRGCLYPNLQGFYIYGDFSSGRLFKLEENGTEWTNTDICLGTDDICTGNLVNTFPRNILSFGEDESGELYMLVTNIASSTNPGGKIFRFVDPNKRGNPEECDVEERPVPVFDTISPNDNGATEGQYYGKLIETFNTQPSSSQRAVGTVYGVDETHIYITGFTFDGNRLGTDARFFAGSSGGPDETGVIIPDERGTTSRLGVYNNQNLLLTLPDGTTLSSLSWIAVWDVNTQSDYGRVFIPAGFTPPRPSHLGPMGFSPRIHNVHAENVIIVNSKQFTFVNLDYDGTAPAAFFWTGKGQPDPSGRRVADPDGNIRRRLPSYRDATLTITLPENLTVFDVDYIGIWCEAVYQNFGHVTIMDEHKQNIPPYIEVPELPQLQEGCVELIENRYQVYWELRESDNRITIQLLGRVALNEYMAFGISGSETGTLMFGSDVSVVWIDPNTNEAQGEDYQLSAYSQCVVNSGIGACPDTFSISGVNNVEIMSTEVQDGIIAITFERPLVPDDPLDKPIPTDRPVFISWALGFINSIGLVSRHHTRTEGDLSIHFGNGEFNCPEFTPLTDDPVLDPWSIDPLFNTSADDTFVAFIGPAGGLKGYQGITGQVGWGIAWYINSSLIPEIYVHRGSTYRFEVYGGDDPRILGNYHPFYITDNIEGGYGQKLPEDQAEEVIYAGPVEGSLCEYQNTFGINPDDFEDFYDYFETLSLDCPEDSEPGILEWTVAEDTPDIVYYQCYIHRYLGWTIHVLDAVATTTENVITGIVFDCPIEASTIVSPQDERGVVFWTEPSSTNLQGPVALSARTHGPGQTFPVGVTEVTYVFVSTINGDQAVCTFPVYVEQDFSSPLSVFQCPSDTEVFVQPGVSSAVVTYLEPYALDSTNSDGILENQNCISGASFSIGTTFCEYSFRDQFGNTASCFFSIDVLTVQSACDTSPCQNGGICFSLGQINFICVCRGPFTGTRCEQVQNACTPNPCQNGGFCTLSGTSGFTCSCASGFTGGTCSQVSVQRACDSSPCQNGATCFSFGPTQFFCLCQTSFSGTRCELGQNACTPNPCQNGGACTPSGATGFTCNCVTGFTGATCFQAQRGCDSSPCQNGGTCFSLGPTQFFCSCPSAFSGMTCEESQNACDRISCPINTPCVGTDLSGSLIVCQCVNGILGFDCFQFQNPCTANPCENGGFCFSTRTSTFICTCTTGFTGSTCTESLNTRPVITCPAPVMVASFPSSIGNFASWAVPSCSDAEDGTITTSACIPRSGSFFQGVGENTVSCTCVDSGGLSDECTFLVTIEGFNTPPVITCPGPVVVTSLVNNVGNLATWDPPICVDAEDGTITTSVCVPVSGSFFRGVGENTVTCTCTDSGQLSDECTFPVTVEGFNTPPVITCPAPVVVTSLVSNIGNTATWEPPTCVDAEDGTITTSVCVPISGTFFRGVGANIVTCTCRDSGGLSDECTFPVTVEGVNTQPVITCPSPVVVTSFPSNIGNFASWDVPACVDAEDGTITTSACVPRSGSFFFGVGENTITCTCTDSGGLSDECTFPVTIEGFNTPPMITCPAPVAVTSLTNNIGNTATWDPPTCVDTGDGTITTSVCIPTSGSFFAGVGENTVTCTCTDSGGLSDECTFPVTVEGFNTPPVITCPSPVMVTSFPNDIGNFARWDPLTCVDAEDGTITTSACVPRSGSFFRGVGENTVTCTCIDSDGLSDECTFPVTIEAQNACTPNPCQNGGFCTLSSTSGFTCSCVTGFTGITCAQTQSGCDSSPCQNGGTCISLGPTQFLCSCPSTFSGTRCEQAQNVCSSSPCLNGGTCFPLGPTLFFCSCPSPFSGTRCEQVQNACSPNPCQNGGSCTLSGTSGFTCRCVTGFTGTTCTQTQRGCDSSPCQNGGTCFSLGPTQFFCSCLNPFSGTTCEDVQNACTPNPCQNGGSCTLSGTSFTCSCLTGFTGTTCTQTQRGCDSSPCQNGGACFSLGPTQFFCSCPSTFSGTTCENAQNACTPNPCQNGGSCTLSGTSGFTCRCVTGFTGTTCTQTQRGCDSSPCQNGGTCFSLGPTQFFCNCPSPFSGTTCEDSQNACTPNPCQNGGSCTLSGTSGFTCSCVTGFTGNTCTQTQRGCDSSPCQNGGTCFSLGPTQFFCNCLSPFSGTTCEQVQNACSPNPCQNGGSCTLSGTSGFTCSCVAGFTGTTCAQAQRGCDSSPCQNGGTCFSLGPTQFLCNCPATFSGTRCEQAQNACTPNPCQNGGSCTLSGTSGFTCRCATGFTGTTCTQIQNACTPNPCQNGGSCILSGTGGFICSCVTGFTGTTCTQTQRGCDSSPCQNGGTCFSLGPTQFFCNCPATFSGTRCEQVQNACTPNPCQNGGSCTLSGASGFTCRCVTGFTGTTCTQIQNACTPNPCQNGGSCTLSGTSGFICSCVTGFTGTTCTQIQNACTPNPCQNGGSCTLSGTSGFTCRCVTGFTGTTCTQTESQLQNCPEDDLMFDNFDIITWTEPTHTGGTLIFQSHFSGGEFPIGRSTVVYTFDVNGQNETCEFDVIVEEISDPGGQLPLLEFTQRENEELQSFSLSQTTPALIRCTVTTTDGFTPNIIWYMGDRQLQNGEDGRIFYGAGGQFLVLFAPLNSDDAGQYRCEASIPSQPVSGSMAITVTLTD